MRVSSDPSLIALVSILGGLFVFCLVMFIATLKGWWR